MRHLLEAERREAAKGRLLELTVKYDFYVLVNYTDIYRWWLELDGEVTAGPLYVAATEELLNKQEKLMSVKSSGQHSLIVVRISWVDRNKRKDLRNGRSVCVITAGNRNMGIGAHSF